MAARITEVRNAVAELIDVLWVARESADDEVIARTLFELDSATLAGRKVYVMRSAFTGGPVNRTEDQDDYTIALMVVERYAGQGPPPEEWIDERVEWCEWLLRQLGNPRGDRLLAEPGEPDSGLWPEVAEVAEVHDVDELTTRKLFASLLTLTYREQVEV